MQRVALGLMVVFIVAVCWPVYVSAHGIIAGGAEVLDVQAGSYPLRIEVTVPSGAPASLTAKIWSQRDLAGATQILLTATHQNSKAIVQQQVNLPAGSRTISVFDVLMPHTGVWELRIQIQDAQHGIGVATVPVTIYPNLIPPLTIPMFVAVAILALVLFSATIWPEARPLVRVVQAHTFTAALSITVVIGALMAWPNLRVDIPTADPTSRPYVVSQVQQIRDNQLQILVHDGLTGLPVDDLVLHHQALMHMVVIDPVSHTLLHLHPARVKPGQYLVDLPVITQGTYDVAIEIERANSGSQVTHQQVLLGELSARSVLVPVPVPATIQSGDYTLTVQMATPARVGVPVEVQVTATRAGQAVAALDFWLGMRGHMIVRNPNGAVFGHAHAVGAMNDAFQPVSVPGNQVSFVYAFPSAETYAVWVQIMIDGAVITLPVQITVNL